MQLVQQHARYGRIASRKEKTNNALAHHLTALETVLLHPLITKSGAKQNRIKRARKETARVD